MSWACVFRLGCRVSEVTQMTSCMGALGFFFFFFDWIFAWESLTAGSEGGYKRAVQDRHSLQSITASMHNLNHTVPLLVRRRCERKKKRKRLFALQGLSFYGLNPLFFFLLLLLLSFVWLGLNHNHTNAAYRNWVAIQRPDAWECNALMDPLKTNGIKPD